MKRRLLLLSAFAPALPAFAAGGDVLAQVRRRLADSPVLKGAFEQRKTVKGFRNPLVSRGDFLVARDRGVVWATREPFASQLIVTRDRLLSKQADGSVMVRPGATVVHDRLHLRKEPVVRCAFEHEHVGR